MAAQLALRTALGGQVGGRFGFHREAVAINLFAHEFRVEGAGPRRVVDSRERSGDFGRAAHPNAVAALLPEEEFEEPLGVNQVERGGGVTPAEDPAVMPRDASVDPFQDQDEGTRRRIGRDKRAEFAMPEKGRQEAGIQRRTKAR